MSIFTLAKLSQKKVLPFEHTTHKVGLTVENQSLQNGVVPGI